jgi:hypothetical protein
LSDRDLGGTQNDIFFGDSGIVINRKPNGRPDCTVPAEIQMGPSGFAFRPHGCEPDSCTGIRALVYGLDRTPLREGVIFTCKVTVTRSGILTNTGVIVSEWMGNTPESRLGVGYAGLVCVAA